MDTAQRQPAAQRSVVSRRQEVEDERSLTRESRPLRRARGAPSYLPLRRATKPKCCDMERGVAAWEFLKRRLKELGLSEQGGILRKSELPSHL